MTGIHIDSRVSMTNEFIRKESTFDLHLTGNRLSRQSMV